MMATKRITSCGESRVYEYGSQARQWRDWCRHSKNDQMEGQCPVRVAAICEQMGDHNDFSSAAEILWLESLKIAGLQYMKNSDSKQFKLPGTRFYPDGISAKERAIYEYNGCFWHGCDRCYDREMIHPVARVSMAASLERTDRKRDLILASGLVDKVVERWPCDNVDRVFFAPK